MLSSNEDHTQIMARIRLHGLTKSSNGSPCPIELTRKISFPMPADCTDIEADYHDKDLSARLLAPKFDIEARVCFVEQVSQQDDDDNDDWLTEPVPVPEHALGFGKAGKVYPLEIISVKPFPVNSSSSSSGATTDLVPILPPLCVKVATPGHARNLAREAWFYEQLDTRNLTLLANPRCYGVFHAPNIPDDICIDIPGYDHHYIASMPLHDDTGLYTALLPEELYDRENDRIVVNTRHFMDDYKKSHSKSEWTPFRETPGVTTMTVLVMDLLGPPLTIEEFERDWNQDISEVWDHLAPLDIIHEDVRLPNVLQVPPDLRVPCPMHPNAGAGHRWTLSDWESAKILCLGPDNPVNVFCQRHRLVFDYACHGGKLEDLYPSWFDYFTTDKETGARVYTGYHGRWTGEQSILTDGSSS